MAGTMTTFIQQWELTLVDDDIRAVDLKITKDSLIAYSSKMEELSRSTEWYPRLAHAPP